MIIMKSASKTTILPPPSGLEEVKIPKPPRLPEIKNPTPEELEEQAENKFIYDRDQFLVNLLLKHRRYEQALDEIEREIEEYEASKKKTEIYHKSNAELVNLIKSCNNFYKLCLIK